MLTTSIVWLAGLTPFTALNTSEVGLSPITGGSAFNVTVTCPTSNGLATLVAVTMTSTVEMMLGGAVYVP